MKRFYKIPIDKKTEILQECAGNYSLPPFAIEKDWWVVQTLTILYDLEIGKHLVFKGGTSLSKAWGLIDRFSEDIDLAIDRSFFGFDGELGKSKRTKLRKASNIYMQETVFPQLQEQFAYRGLENIRFSLGEIKSSDQDPVVINVDYPNVVDSPGYIQPRIQVEIGSRSLREPLENKKIISMLDENYPLAPFAQSSILVPTVTPERTFLEKIFLLHEEFQRPTEKIRVNRLSRHLYDLFQLANTKHAEQAFKNKDLFTTIVNHRKTYTRVSGVDYNLHQPQTLNPVPPPHLQPIWEKDYKTMQEQMIYGNSPSFDELMQELENLKDRFKNVNWKMAEFT